MAPLALTLTQEFPTLKDLRGKTVLVKYGGAAMEDDSTKQRVCEEVAALSSLGIKVVVVHGGGKEISRMMERVGLTPHFIDGLRVTDSEAMKITEMVLTGSINSDLVSRITRAGTPALGLSGRDARLLTAVKLQGRNGEDLGQTGEVSSCNTAAVYAALAAEALPVVSPVGESVDGTPMNLNADYAAAAIAGALKASACVFLTDVPGVKSGGVVQPHLTRQEVAALIENGTITGGMIPKVECALRALDDGCHKAVIAEAARQHVIAGALTGAPMGGTVLT
jgi:acetylglutamate kinase